MKGKQLKTAIKEAINAHGHYTTVKVWSVEVDDPHFLTEVSDMVITVSVRERKRKKK